MSNNYPPPPEDSTPEPPKPKDLTPPTPSTPQNAVPPTPPRVEHVSYYQPPIVQGESVVTRLAWGVGGGLGCLGLLLAAVLIPLAITLGSIGAVVDRVGSGLQAIFNPEPPVATVFQSQTIINSLQPMGHLVTSNAQVAKADIEVRVIQGINNICGHSANHVAVAEFSAGIDLYAVDTDNITYDERTNTYTIQVPAPIITNCSMESIDQYQTQKNGATCTVNWDDLRQLAQYESMLEFREDMLEGGLLITAQRETEIALSSFVGAITGADVQIVFIENESQSALLAACQPELPDGWVQDADTGAWIRE